MNEPVIWQETPSPKPRSPLYGRTRRRTADGKVVYSPPRTPEQQQAVEQTIARIRQSDPDERGPSLSELRRRAEAKLVREGRKLIRSTPLGTS